LIDVIFIFVKVFQISFIIITKLFSQFTF